MTYAMYTQPTDYLSTSTHKVSDICLHREGANKIVVFTRTTLSDEQMQDLYWAVCAMEGTGKTLHELFISKEGRNDEN